MSDENLKPDATPDTTPEATPEAPPAPEAAPQESLVEDVEPATSAADTKAKRWMETKGDLKWASVLLFVAILVGPKFLSPFFNTAIYSKWTTTPTGVEDMDALTTLIFSQDGLVAPFEILSVLLLAALIAGVAISLRDPIGGDEMAPWRSRDPEPESLEGES